MDSNIDKAFYYIELALQSGWTEADMLATDPYFNYLRTAKLIEWEQLVNKTFVVEKKYELSLKLPALRKKINLMALNDQRLRYERIQANSGKDDKKINQEIYLSDSSNRVQAKLILNKYGWPKISEVGKDGQNNFWLIIQHADDDVIFQQSALSAMQKLKNTDEIIIPHQTQYIDGLFFIKISYL